MDAVGLVCAVLAAAGAGFAWWRPRHPLARAALIVPWWLAVVWLGTRFASLDLTLAAVVRYSRASLPGWLRISGLWAGPAGSLLLWCAAMVTAIGLATRASPRTIGVRLASLSSVVGLAMLGIWANPFALDHTVPVDGNGLSPVLEHPAMLVHPPLLYLAQAAVVFTAVTWWLQTDATRSRRSVGVAAALLVVATFIGAWWAHDELGWGGWWGWDPVENTALAPLAALVAALHARRLGAPTAARRWTMAAAALVLVGVGAARSGLASSVHAFAPSLGPGIVLTAAGLAVFAAAFRRVAHDGEGDRSDIHVGRDRRARAVVYTACAWIVVVVVSGEVAAAILGSGTPPASLDGGVLARTMIPSGVALAAGVAWWGFRQPHRAALVAHVGVAVLAVGITASTADRSTTLIGRAGESTTGRHDVTFGEPVLLEPRVDLDRIVAPVTVDGVRYRPAILRYNDLQRSRSRPDRSLDWRGETEVSLVFVDSERISIEVRRHPGLGQVWAGAALMATGFVLMAGRRQDRSRRRFAASNESIDEPVSPDVGGEGAGFDGGSNAGAGAAGAPEVSAS